MIFPATADHFGRSVVIVSTMTIFAAFSIGVAAGNNIGEGLTVALADRAQRPYLSAASFPASLRLRVKH